MTPVREFKHEVIEGMEWTSMNLLDYRLEELETHALNSFLTNS